MRGNGVVELLAAIIETCPNRKHANPNPKYLTHLEVRPLKDKGSVNCENCKLRELTEYWWDVCREEAHERQEDRL